MPVQLVFKKISHLGMCTRSLHFTHFDLFTFDVKSNTKKITTVYILVSGSIPNLSTIQLNGI